MISSRMLHKAYANFNGYFWLPCPHCGEYFGGHEWQNVDGKESSIPDPEYPGNGSRGIGICPDCTRSGIGRQYWDRFEETYGSRWDNCR